MTDEQQALSDALDRLTWDLVGDLTDVAHGAIHGLRLAAERLREHGDVFMAEIIDVLADGHNDQLERIAARGKQ